MISLSSNNVLIPAVAALLIFIIGYFVLLFSVILGLVLVDLTYRGGRMLWLHMKMRAASKEGPTSKVSDGVHVAPGKGAVLSHVLAAVRRPSL